MFETSEQGEQKRKQNDVFSVYGWNKARILKNEGSLSVMLLRVGKESCHLQCTFQLFIGQTLKQHHNENTLHTVSCCPSQTPTHRLAFVTCYALQAPPLKASYPIQRHISTVCDIHFIVVCVQIH